MPEIFVFGSNLQGIHGKGAALTAHEKHGAIMGQGIGLQGNSYAIPTKETPYKTLDIIAINRYVAEFLHYALETPLNCYIVTQVGCGLAGYKRSQIAPLFALAKELSNVKLPSGFSEFLQGMEI